MKLLNRLTLLCFALLVICAPAVAQQKRARKGADLSIPNVEKKDLICFALYTVHDNTLKLTAQLYPLSDSDPKTVRLEIEKDGKWTEVARTNVIEAGWTAPFRVENWDDSKSYKYRVAHGSEAFYQ